MTFKVKSGINVGNLNVIDSDSKYQQTASLPVNKPSLMLDFVNTPSLDRRLTFARSSNGTFISQRGLVETATSNVPRFDYANNVCQGVLIEEQRTNYVTFSGDFTYSDWAKNGGGISINRAATMAPDGSMSADIVTAPGSGAGIYRFVGGLSNNVIYTQSVYVKNISNTTTISVGCDTNPSGGFVVFNLSTGTITSVGGSVAWSRADNIGNGWFRVGCSFTTTATNPSFIIYPNQACQYAIWGPQMEVNYGATSYIRSTETFISRSSNATYIDSTDNLIKTATANVVRPLYNPFTRVNSGQLLEAAATNLLFPSNIGSGWNYSATTLNDATAPDGTLTASTTTVASGSFLQPYLGAITVTSSTVYTYSFYVKLGTFTPVGEWLFAVYDETNSAFIASNITPNVTPVTHEWRRVTYTFTTPATCTAARIYVFRNQSVTTGGTIFTWGAQLETGYSATSYISTTTATVTRAADSYSSATTTRQYDSLSTTNRNWFDPTQGTFVMDFDTMSTTNSPFILKGDSEYITGRGGFDTIGTWDGTNEVNVTNSLANTAVYASFGASWSSAGKLLSLNGSIPIVNTNSTFSSAMPGSFIFGSTTGGSRSMLGHIKRVVYYPQRVSNNELQALTKI